MGSEREQGGQGPLTDFEIFSKKWLLSYFRVGKIKFIHLWSPLEKFRKNPLVSPWKKSFRRP